MDTMEVMMKEFIAETPSDNDLEGIENLCKQLFKHFSIDIKEFARILVEQNYVTTVLKESLDENGPMEDEDIDDAENTVYGVYSVVNLKTKKDRRVVKQLIKFIQDASNNTVDGDIFKDVLSDGSENPYRAGFLVKEKIMNIPGVASCPLMQQLINDIKESTEKGMPYDFTHYIHLAKMVRMKHDSDYFVDQDDELIHKNHLSYLDIDFDSTIDSRVMFQNNEGENMGGKSFRRIYIFSKTQLDEFMHEMTKLESVKEVMEEAHGSGLKLTY